MVDVELTDDSDGIKSIQNQIDKILQTNESHGTDQDTQIAQLEC